MDSTIRLFEYKTKALNQMLLNSNIIKALIDNTEDFMDNIDPLIDNQDFRDSLLYSKIFPYMPITSKFTESTSYITMSLGAFDSQTSVIVNGLLKIYVICHLDVVKTQSGQRHGFIANEIDNMMFRTNGFGIGKISGKRIEEITIDDKYIGVFLQYQISDFSL
jgi:hypothetical protein